ncbi:Chloride channel protein 2, partial [Toxocara canis]
HTRNVLHFLVEDWCLSAMLGIITAVLSVGMDVAIEKLQHCSGIPEVKVIMHGFKMKNYLTFRTLIAKMIGLTLAIGSGLPIGKEGPFVHMGAIVATLLSKLTKACQYSAFFSNEGREMEMLSSGCAVGIACTFSAPVGG